MDEREDDMDGVCKHCGGMVNDDGYAKVLGEEEEFTPFEGEETDQHESTVKMREDGFASAIRRRGSR